METHLRATGRHLPHGITQLPATWHKWTRPTLTAARQTGTWFTYTGEMEGWVDLGVGYIPRWLTCPKTVTHPSSNRPGVQQLRWSRSKRITAVRYHIYYMSVSLRISWICYRTCIVEHNVRQNGANLHASRACSKVVWLDMTRRRFSVRKYDLQCRYNDKLITHLQSSHLRYAHLSFTVAVTSPARQTLEELVYWKILINRIITIALILCCITTHK